MFTNEQVKNIVFLFAEKILFYSLLWENFFLNKTRKNGLSSTTKGSHLTVTLSFLSTQEFSQCFVIRKTFENHVRSVTSDRFSSNSHKCGNSIKQEGMFSMFPLSENSRKTFECDNMKIVDHRAVLRFILTDACSTYKLLLIRGKMLYRRKNKWHFSHFFENYRWTVNVPTIINKWRRWNVIT